MPVLSGTNNSAPFSPTIEALPTGGLPPFAKPAPPKLGINGTLSSPPPPPASMSEEELDVIAKAIEGVQEL